MSDRRLRRRSARLLVFKVVKKRAFLAGRAAFKHWDGAVQRVIQQRRKVQMVRRLTACNFLLDSFREWFARRSSKLQIQRRRASGWFGRAVFGSSGPRAGPRGRRTRYRAPAPPQVQRCPAAMGKAGGLVCEWSQSETAATEAMRLGRGNRPGGRGPAQRALLRGVPGRPGAGPVGFTAPIQGEDGISPLRAELGGVFCQSSRQRGRGESGEPVFGFPPPVPPPLRPRQAAFRGLQRPEFRDSVSVAVVSPGREGPDGPDPPRSGARAPPETRTWRPRPAVRATRHLGTVRGSRRPVSQTGISVSVCGAREIFLPRVTPGRRVKNRGRVRPAPGGGPEFTASGVPRETFQPGDPAFPPISAPRAPPSPRLFSLQSWRNHSTDKTGSPPASPRPPRARNGRPHPAPRRGRHQARQAGPRQGPQAGRRRCAAPAPAPARPAPARPGPR